MVIPPTPTSRQDPSFIHYS